MLPLTLPIWLAGLWYLFFHREGRTFRAAGMGLADYGRASL